MMFSEKQKEYLANANHRWNVKQGATRSGKTYLDYYVIPKRIRAVSGKDGLIVLLGNTKGTLQRNIIEPLQQIWGTALVSNIRSDNTAMLFGEKVFCLGADKVNQVDRLRGSSICYCYGDEVVTWHQDVFEMLKSRLDKPYSCFDGTCNPESPNHWFKAFLDSDVDIYSQSYTIDDNPFLDSKFVDNLKREYWGTVFYDRYILGKWTVAEGAIYQIFADNKSQYYTDTPDYDYVQVGIDFGGNKSAHTFVATGLKYDYSKLTVLMSERHVATGLSPDDLYDLLERFIKKVTDLYKKPLVIYADSAEQTLINGIKARFTIPIKNSIKNPIIDRIRATIMLLSSGRFYITKDCVSLEKAFETAVYDSKKPDDVRLDDGTSDIDTLDAFEYSWEKQIKAYTKLGGVERE